MFYTVGVLFLESSARLLLVVHAVVGVATVATATHLVIWLAKKRDARFFATVGFCCYAAQFLLGNFLYPTYKVRVRAEYFDQPAAATERASIAQGTRDLIDEGVAITAANADRKAPAPSAKVNASRNLSSVGRTFDVKEHWAALGLATSLAVCALAWAWRKDPDADERQRRLLLGLAWCTALCAWAAGLIGLWVTAYQAV